MDVAAVVVPRELVTATLVRNLVVAVGAPGAVLAALVAERVTADVLLVGRVAAGAARAAFGVDTGDAEGCRPRKWTRLVTRR